MKIFLLLLLIPFQLGAQTLLFVGDSLTEGYNLTAEEAYPAQLELLFKEAGKNIKVVNGGVSGATSASGVKRLKWYLKAKPTHVIVFLGANDGLRGLKLDQTEKALGETIDLAIKQKLKVYLVQMKLPLNYGAKYRGDFEAMYPRLSKKYDVPLLPFPMEEVAGKKELNLPDGIHPNAQGYKLIAKQLFQSLEPLL